MASKENRVHLAAEGSLKVVAVDGPAGSGKSSVCSLISEKLGWTHLSTGFLYRAIALVARDMGKALSDDRALKEIALDFCESLSWNPVTMEVKWREQDLSSRLYSDDIGRDASFVAQNPVVRHGLLNIQRRFAFEASQGAVIDGRDIGTVVFPDAPLKIFLTASIEERANRRWLQLKGRKVPSPTSEDYEDYLKLKDSISIRDRQDSERGAAPLKKADDAIVLDTSGLQPSQVVDRILNLIQENGLLPGKF